MCTGDAGAEQSLVTYCYFFRINFTYVIASIIEYCVKFSNDGLALQKEFNNYFITFAF